MRESYMNQEEKEGKAVDNYKVLCEKWREIFLTLDLDSLAERFGLERDEEALYITFYRQKYRLDRKNGMITLMEEPERELLFNTIMCIYHLFYYSKETAKVRGEFVPFRQVKRAAPFDAAFQKGTLRFLAKTFDGRAELLRKACEALGGERVPQGDVGYRIEAFSCMPVVLVFWDGDDEFGARANILFDADITDFTHEETVVCVAGELTRRLMEEAGLTDACQAFSR